MEKATLRGDITFKSTSQANDIHGEIKPIDADGKILDTNHAMPHKLPTQLYTTINEFTVESGEKLINATIAFTVNGSPYGSASPLSSQFRDGQAKGHYGPAFPKTTIRDDVRIHKHVMDLLGVKSIYCVIGGSMGGMLALEWAFFGMEYVRSAVLIATAARQSAWAIAWAENQRSTIRCDLNFLEGFYGDNPPIAGLGAARMAALLTYRTHQSFESRFGRRRVDDGTVLSVATNSAYRSRHLNPEVAAICPQAKDGRIILDAEPREQSGIFSAQSYLRYQGEKFNERFDANCYLHILDKIDSHDITRGRSSNLSDGEAIKEVLGQIQQPTLVIGIPTDGLYPISEQLALFEKIPNATFASVESKDGHDGFLLEGEQMNIILHSFFDQDLYHSKCRRETYPLERKLERDQVEIRFD
ncbi:hypothetical protein G7Y89_g9248 [Cudoniella acicularis]|uniref:AB hydrolase-1 domain-containing protein n=1 Tax=Cudoniella acicularis TaxID=354080 RepID=A0A8H4RHB9_9HELO|nr:hypothetical protein G7Y89_g9248 [Cudoniella acicularis]